MLDESIGKRYDNEEDPQALYGYDLDGNRISMDDVAGTTGYEYDKVGRITAVNLSNGKKIKYSYDEYGNISKLTYPDNTTVQYTYNELDQLTQIKDRQGKVTKYARDANGSITKVTRPNNTYSTIEYDDMGNVIKVVNMGKNPYYGIEEELSSFAYTYDKSGFITGEAAKNGRRIEASQYEYDERGQLVKVSQTVTENNQFVEETEMVYTYDGAGNRLSAVKTSSGKILCNIQYTYNDNSQITDIESDCDDDKQTHIVLTYDENGNLKNTTCNDTEKVRDYTYDNENRLKAVKENGSLLMAALYDGNGDRIFRLDYCKNDEYVSNKAGTAENVYYPSGSVNSAYDTDFILNEMLIPNDVTNNTAINYELTGYINDINTEYTQTLMEFGANGNTTNIYEYGAQRNSATINGTKGYYLYDGRGSVAGLTGNSGGSMITYRYDAYGNTTKSNNTLNNPYQYNAEYTDSSTGLQYLRARYYDSSQGRFTAKDTYLGTIPNPLSCNLYTYVENNPLNYIDPSGHTARRRPDPMRNMPLIGPIDQIKIDNQIAKQSFHPLDGIKAATHPGGPKAYYDEKIENVYGEHFFGKGYSNPTGPYRLKTDSSLGYVSNRKEAKTKLQKAIDDRKINLHKTYCENGAQKAKDDGKKQNSKFHDYFAGLLLSLTSNIADPTGILTELIYNTLGVDISGDSYLADFESAYNAGRITGDVISTVVGIIELIKGFSDIGASVTLAAGGTLATATGVGAPVGVPAISVSVGGVVVGVAEVGVSLATLRSSLSNLYDDVQNYNSSRITNPSKSESPIWKSFDNVKGSDRKTSGTGKNKRYYEWDNTHNDIEVYDKNGKHLGSMDPTTGEMYKPAVPGRTITIN